MGRAFETGRYDSKPYPLPNLFGGFGNDIMNGGKGNDWLFGGFGDDELDGEDGFDWMFGGPGLDDLLNGERNFD